MEIDDSNLRNYYENNDKLPASKFEQNFRAHKEKISEKDIVQCSCEEAQLGHAYGTIYTCVRYNYSLQFLSAPEISSNERYSLTCNHEMYSAKFCIRYWLILLAFW